MCPVQSARAQSQSGRAAVPQGALSLVGKPSPLSMLPLVRPVQLTRVHSQSGRAAVPQGALALVGCVPPNRSVLMSSPIRSRVIINKSTDKGICFAFLMNIDY